MQKFDEDQKGAVIIIIGWQSRGKLWSDTKCLRRLLPQFYNRSAISLFLKLCKMRNQSILSNILTKQFMHPAGSNDQGQTVLGFMSVCMPENFKPCL